MKSLVTCVVAGFFSFVLSLAAQTSGSGAAVAQVPPVIQFSSVATDEAGSALSGPVAMTFSLYNDARGGEPLWSETQSVPLDSTGHYSVYLGIARANGVPVSLFATGQARWLGVQIAGQAEQPRAFLVSVPYAIKAGDAATVGGLPPSAFMLAAPGGGSASTSSFSSPSGSGGNAADIGGSGTQNYIPIWTDNSGNLGDSILFQSSGNEVGIGTKTPTARLDVNGGVVSRGPLQLPSKGTATAAGGFNSQTLNLQGSSFNSNTGKAIGPLFQWQTEPSGNNTPTPSGTLNLLYGNGSGAPSETGLNIASNGQITFVSGQSFPGTGTITGITAGTGLTGGGTSGNVTIGINAEFPRKYYARLAAANTFTKNQTVNGTMTATAFSGNGAGLTKLQGANVQGTVATANNALNLGGLAPSAYQPAGSYATTGSNTFTGDQNVTGKVAVTGSISGEAGSFTGPVTAAGALLPASGTATAGKGFASQPLDSVASAYNSITAKAENKDFRWQAEPVGNDSGAPSGKFNLLFGSNGATPTETGLSVASSGQISFASGQTFPGAGTVTSVGSGAGLTGGPITGSGALSIATGGVTNAMLTNPGLTVAAGTDLTGGGAVALGGTTTLNVDTAKVPQLNSANTFTSNQTITSASGIALQATSSKQTVQVATPKLLLNGISNGLSVFSVDRSGNGVYEGGLTVGNLVLGPSTGIVLQAINTAGANVSLATQSFLISAFSNSGDAFNVDYQGNVTVVGNLSVGGSLSKGSGSFKIDHPLDPANKYLYHSFVESPDMMNVYNGNIVTNKRGVATVVLPDYFEALNRDFRYQLTVIGQFAQAIVAKEISHGRFTVRTNRPGVKVSWQVTGIRQDAYANAHRIQVEEEKPPQEQGRYLHPELFGAPPERAIGARAPSGAAPVMSGTTAELAAK